MCVCVCATTSPEKHISELDFIYSISIWYYRPRFEWVFIVDDGRTQPMFSRLCDLGKKSPKKNNWRNNWTYCQLDSMCTIHIAANTMYQSPPPPSLPCRYHHKLKWNDLNSSSQLNWMCGVAVLNVHVIVWQRKLATRAIGSMRWIDNNNNNIDRACGFAESMPRLAVFNFDRLGASEWKSDDMSRSSLWKGYRKLCSRSRSGCMLSLDPTSNTLTHTHAYTQPHEWV